MDDREDVKSLTCYRSHSKPVWAVKVTDRHVLSLSVDKILVVYDRVAGQELKRINIQGRCFTTDSLSLQDNSLYVGDSGGGLNLINARQDMFTLVKSYDTGLPFLQSVSAGLGSVVTGASDGRVRVFQPDREMALINNVQVLLRIVSAQRKITTPRFLSSTLNVISLRAIRQIDQSRLTSQSINCLILTQSY